MLVASTTTHLHPDLGQLYVESLEGLENMTTTPETSLEANAGPHRACTAWAKQSFYSLAPKTALVQPNQGKTHAKQSGNTPKAKEKAAETKRHP